MLRTVNGRTTRNGCYCGLRDLSPWEPSSSLPRWGGEKPLFGRGWSMRLPSSPRSLVLRSRDRGRGRVSRTSQVAAEKEGRNRLPKSAVLRARCPGALSPRGMEENNEWTPPSKPEWLEGEPTRSFAEKRSPVRCVGNFLPARPQVNSNVEKLCSARGYFQARNLASPSFSQGTQARNARVIECRRKGDIFYEFC